MSKTIKGFLSITVIFMFLGSHANQTIGDQNSPRPGIEWTHGLSWEQIKKKSLIDNKYIFVDFYATWCKPCKAMDSEVYGNDSVGNVVNPKFISIKVQIDTSEKDEDEIKQWYEMAQSMRREYNIVSMPTFLFFAPGGRLVHKEVGGKNIKQFITTVQSATDTSKQFYELVEKFKANKIAFEKMIGLAQLARSNGEEELAIKIARMYMNGFLNQDIRRYSERANKDLLIDYYYYFLYSSDSLFRLCLDQSSKMDSLFGKAINSQKIIDYVIDKEEIQPRLRNVRINSHEPRWTLIARAIRRKYGANIAQRLTTDSKVEYYQKKKNWAKYCSSLVLQVEIAKKQGSRRYSSDMFLNDCAWNVFLYSNRKKELTKALEWSGRSVAITNPSSYNMAPNMETKANLLYKLGMKDKAIAQQKRALERLIADAEKHDFIKRSNDINDYKRTLDQMETGEITHTESGAIWISQPKGK